jgi:hypothetical protein
VSDITIEKSKDGYGYSVYEWGVFPPSSVLAGQTMKQFVDRFDDLEEAQAAYPQADLGFRDPMNTFDHLPDPDEPESWRMTDGEFDDGSH